MRQAAGGRLWIGSIQVCPLELSPVMSNAKARDARLVSRLLRRERAADYADVCLPFFLKCVSAGIFSPPRLINNIEVYDRTVLDRDIDALPFKGGAAPARSTWDD